MNEVVTEEEYAESHYMKPDYVRATTETPAHIGDFKEPVVALINHGFEIDLMSMEFYKKGKCLINTKHGWKICTATEELHGVCPNIQVKVEDVEIDQHFFVRRYPRIR